MIIHGKAVANGVRNGEKAEKRNRRLTLSHWHPSRLPRAVFEPRQWREIDASLEANSTY